MVFRIPLPEHEARHAYGRLPFKQYLRQGLRSRIVCEAILILGKAQALPQLLLHGVAYEQLARRSPVTREPGLAHPSGHGYLQSGKHPVRKGSRFDTLIREVIANAIAPVAFQVRGVVDLGADIDTTIDTQPTPSYGIRYQHRRFQSP